ncbi:MAG: FAD-dependent oxidoreductase [Bacteroidota bacterium]
MKENLNAKTCLVIGASHAGVNFAFELRKEGWDGHILLFDADPRLPYHRPPLSKDYLGSKDKLDKHVLKSADAYSKAQIELRLGIKVKAINREGKCIVLSDDSQVHYDKLVLATGARPLIPPIPGIEKGPTIFPMRNAQDAIQIRDTFHQLKDKKILVIGGGYIGLETAASLKKLGGDVTVLERDSRVLARVTVPELSSFFQELHEKNGVDIFTNKNVIQIERVADEYIVECADGSRFQSEMIVLGVGIQVNSSLAAAAGLEIENGIKVDATARTSDPDIYAIGDCTFHHNPHYDRFIRLESVQNAVGQAKIAAASISGKEDIIYDTIPWFWSDQYHVKLQMVGLSQGYDEMLIRKEQKEDSFSIWYFKKDQLLAVDAVNNAKAYVLGTKFIKGHKVINKSILADASIALHPKQLLV